MKLPASLFGIALAVIAAPVMAHVGPEAPGQHLFEHIVIGFAIAIPVAYGLLQGFRNRQR